MKRDPACDIQDGFSLLEILIVVAIIGLVTFLVLPGITSYFQVSLHTAAREVGSVTKEAFNSTVLSGKVHRIVYDLKENKYWVESGPATTLLDTKESLEREERRKRFRRESDEKPAPSPFTLEKYVTSKKQSLPRGVSFEDVVTQQSPDPLTEGTAYTHLFPNGMTEQTVIHLKDTANHHASLVIAPLLGRTDVFERYISREDLAQLTARK